jgi:hypothetical protein
MMAVEGFPFLTKLRKNFLLTPVVYRQKKTGTVLDLQDGQAVKPFQE